MSKGFSPRFLFYLLTLLVSMPAGLLAQTTRQTLNDGWMFHRGDAAADVWQRVSLPHTWNTDAYELKNYYRGKGVYQRTLRMDNNDMTGERRIFLKVDAACQSASVYVNGEQALRHRGGYSAFTTDLTPLLRPDADNLLRIEVDNADADAAPVSADFTFMGGIYRDVWIVTTPNQHFDITTLGADGIQVSTTNVSASAATVSVRSSVRNDAPTAATLLVRHDLYAPDGTLLSSTKKRVRVAAAQTVQTDQALPRVTNPRLWSPETPVLYKLVTTLTDTRGHELQREQHDVGFRWYSFDADHGFMLNGQPYKLRGMCIHQDQQPYGVAMDDDMHRRDVRLMKDMGANFVRLAHEQQDDAILQLCDRLGLLVWEEIPIVNTVPESEAFADACEQNLRELIRQHYNHPSIILWGYMNEILLQTNNLYKGEAHGEAVRRILQLANRLERVLKEEDSTRLSTMAFHGSDDYNRHGISNITDVVGWNLYQGWYGGDLTGFERFLASQHASQPTHPIIVSEWGAGSDRRLHTVAGEPFDFSIEYQQRYIEHYIPVIEQTPYVCGASYWNFIDFASAGRDESMPRINNKGVVYADRTPKDVYYYFKASWRDDVPVLHVASHDWSLRSSVNPVLPVKVYTNLSEVELTVNGRSLGHRKADNHMVVFDVPFVGGQNLLVARGTSQGRTVEDATTVTYVPVASEAGANSEIAVNVGSHCSYTSPKSQLTWLPDQPYSPGGWGYVGGQPKSTQVEIAATDEGPLHQTWRQDLEAYCFDVPAGRYELELLYNEDSRQRQQASIYLLGKDAAATGGLVAVRRRMIVDHEGGTLTVSFPRADMPSAQLAAIALRKW